MKLIEAEIDGYGQLNDRRFRLDAPLTIVYGPNEAGKSTMFSFIRTMLYGFARRSQHAERQEPVHGGKHGGRLFIEDQLGHSYVVERYAADGANKLKLSEWRANEADGAWDNRMGEQEALYSGLALSQEEWERRFLGGINERLYRQLFAVTLSELQEIGALSGDELSQYLYQAGWDSGKLIAAAEKKLAQEMDLLFKPRGTNQHINKQLKSLDELDAALRVRVDAIAAYNELREQLELIEDSLTKLEAGRPKSEARLQLLNKAVAMRPLWLRKQQLTRNRASLAYASSLPAGAEKSWEELYRQRKEASEHVERLRLQGLLLEQQHQGLSYDEELILIAGEADALLRTADRMRSLKLDCSEQAEELKALDEAIASLVVRISPEWTERQLRELQLTVAERDYVRRMRERQTERLRAEERFAAELATLEQQEREASFALDEAELAVRRTDQRRELEGGARFVLVPQTKEAVHGAWNALEAALREWELERMRAAGAAQATGAAPAATGRGAAAAAGRGGAGMLLWLGAAGAGGAALALGAAALSSGAASGEPLGAVGLAALALGGVALAVAATAIMRSGSIRNREKARRSIGSEASNEIGRVGRAAVDGDEQRVLAALSALIREPAEAAAALLASPAASSAGASGLASPEHALAAEQVRTQLRSAVQEHLEALQSSERLHDNCSELAHRLDRLRKLITERRAAAAAAAQEDQAAAQQWAGWLAARTLPPSMSAEAALEAFELAEQAVLRLRQYDRLAAKHAAAVKELAAYEAQAAALCVGYAEAHGQLKTDPTLALRLLDAEIHRHQTTREQAHSLAAQLDELKLQCDAASTRLEELTSAMKALIERSGLTEEAEFMAALEHYHMLQDVDKELARLELELNAGLSEERSAQLEQLYADHDEEQLGKLCTAAQADEERLEGERRDLLEQRGRLSQSLDHLLQEDEQQKLLLQREMTVAQLEQDAERYAVLSISSAFIRATKRIYEEERQPIVLRHASRMISTLTDGKYIRVLTTPGSSGIRLEQPDRRYVDSSLLSRGAAEQLYLAMRLALADESSQTVRLPLLLDDVFVNFDQQRLQAASRLVAELAEERQIIIFTCHEHVRNALLAACSHTGLIDMDSRAL